MLSDRAANLVPPDHNMDESMIRQKPQFATNALISALVDAHNTSNYAVRMRSQNLLLCYFAHLGPELPLRQELSDVEEWRRVVMCSDCCEDLAPDGWCSHVRKALAEGNEIPLGPSFDGCFLIYVVLVPIATVPLRSTAGC